ncbi:MAG: hypothetical protein J6S63_07255 [Atopobiaceae bacterium]|nr:hypothetical protein [Atopobiaceae bacterium]
MQLKAFSAAHPDVGMAHSMHAAAWALGLSDRAPATIDVAVPAPLLMTPRGQQRM